MSDPKVNAAPEDIGEAFVQAVRARDAKLFSTLVEKGYTMDKYLSQLTPGEREWVKESAEVEIVLGRFTSIMKAGYFCYLP